MIRPKRPWDYRHRYGVDGIMIGRAAIGYPWIFREIKHYFATGEHLPPPTMDERIATAKQHLDFSVRWKGDRKGIYEMRRHYTNYFRGLPGIKPYRARLVEAMTEGEVLEILDEVADAFAPVPLAAC